MGIRNLLILGGIGFAAWKAKGLLQLSDQLSMSISGLSIPTVSEGVLSTTVQLTAQNPTAGAVTINRVDIQIYQLNADQTQWQPFATGHSKEPQTIKPKGNTPLTFRISKAVSDVPELVKGVLDLIKGGQPMYKVVANVILAGGIRHRVTEYYPSNAKEVLP